MEPSQGHPGKRGLSVGPNKSTQTFFVQSFSTTLRVMDVRTENHGRPRQKGRFPAAPVVRRNFSTPGDPGVRVRNVRGKSGPKSLCLCCFFFPDSGASKWPTFFPRSFENGHTSPRPLKSLPRGPESLSGALRGLWEGVSETPNY